MTSHKSNSNGPETWKTELKMAKHSCLQEMHSQSRQGSGPQLCKKEGGIYLHMVSKSPRAVIYAEFIGVFTCLRLTQPSGC